MDAMALKARLTGDLSTLRTEIGTLEAERISLALPAHSGDQEALLRLIDLRSDIDAKRQTAQDVQQAIDDLDPAVKTQMAAERYNRRLRLYNQFGAASKDAMSAMEALDAAVVQLARAFQGAAEPLGRARDLAVELMVPIQGGVDIGHIALQRMMVAQRVGIRSVAEVVETALEDVGILYRRTAPFPLRSETKLAGEMARSLATVAQRIQDAMSEDRAAAERAGVVFEAEAA